MKLLSFHCHPKLTLLWNRARKVAGESVQTLIGDNYKLLKGKSRRSGQVTPGSSGQSRSSMCRYTQLVGSFNPMKYVFPKRRDMRKNLPEPQRWRLESESVRHNTTSWTASRLVWSVWIFCRSCGFTRNLALTPPL